MGASGSEVPVFGAIPQQAWQWQERPDEATALREALGGTGRTTLVALPGERGAGKSQLAAAYARRCVADGYDLVAWINTESGPVTGLALLADELGLSKADQTSEAAATAVRRWLERDDRARRLVVFDNVDDPDVLRGFLPATGTSKVIITSNRREFTSMPGVTAVPVGMFTPAQGLAFLGKATGLPTTDDAREVGEQLGWLPLGLAQAAACMVHDKLSYRQYLAALEEQDLDETLRRQAGTDHPGVLKATQLSLAGLRRTAVSGDAARLVTVLSVLSPNGISRTLLIQAEPALSLKVGLRHALQVLAARSLITLGGTTQDQHGGDGVVVSMHRLTARVIRHQVGKQRGQQVLGHTGVFPAHEVPVHRSLLITLGRSRGACLRDRVRAAHRLVGCGLAVGALKVRLAPDPDAFHDGQNRGAVGGEPVDDRRRDGSGHDALDEPVGLEFAQLLGQHLGRDRCAQTAEAGEVALAMGQPVQKCQLPLSTDRGERRGHGAAG